MQNSAKSFPDDVQYGIRAVANSIPAILDPKPRDGTLLYFGWIGSSLCAGSDTPSDHPYKSAPPAPDATEARIDAELRRDGILK